MFKERDVESQKNWDTAPIKAMGIMVARERLAALL